MCETQIENKQEQFSLLSFVAQLFDNIKEPEVSGIHIRMTSGNIAFVVLAEVDEKVYVKIDNVEMGHFERYSQQGYLCCFKQVYRVGMRNGRTENEILLESICKNNELIRVFKAYN